MKSRRADESISSEGIAKFILGSLGAHLRNYPGEKDTNIDAQWYYEVTKGLLDTYVEYVAGNVTSQDVAPEIRKTYRHLYDRFLQMADENGGLRRNPQFNPGLKVMSLIYNSSDQKLEEAIGIAKEGNMQGIPKLEQLIDLYQRDKSSYTSKAH